ncbi:MAG: hypothetical protein C4307_01535 [Chloroflexota bacterium]
MGDGELPLPTGAKASLAPAGGDGDEVKRRGELDVDAKLVAGCSAEGAQEATDALGVAASSRTRRRARSSPSGG